MMNDHRTRCRFDLARHGLLAGAAAWLAVGFGGASAQDQFPSETIEVISHASAGGGTDTTARILIYCNNNFVGAPGAMPTKAAPASLNLSTFATLYGYGYRNVYELAPLLDVAETRLPLSGSDAGRPSSRTTGLR